MRPWMGHQEYVDSRRDSRWSVGLLLLIATAVVLIFFYVAVPVIQGH